MPSPPSKARPSYYAAAPPRSEPTPPSADSGRSAGVSFDKNGWIISETDQGKASKRSSLPMPMDSDDFDLAPPPFPPRDPPPNDSDNLPVDMRPPDHPPPPPEIDDSAMMNPLDMMLAASEEDGGDDSDTEDLLQRHRATLERSDRAAEGEAAGFKLMNGVRLKLEDAAEVEKYVESALADFSVEVMLGGSTLDDGIVLFTPGNVCVRTENGVVFEAPTKLSKCPRRAHQASSRSIWSTQHSILH